MKVTRRTVEWSLAALWLWSGLQPPLTAWEASISMLARLGLPQVAQAPLFLLSCAVDVLFAAWIAWRPSATAWRMQALTVSFYSVAVAVALPENWLHPFAPLMKNLPILAMLLWLGADRRTGK
ncbi:epimerase [Chromobacterium violaceum]|uniref:DoxX-like family protein n=1 Tax=Chromobacterium violaceum TaxID=536 RepID=UPI0009DB5D53|nr:DoxX-like family protein [Chromobacterium violaceum]OQS09135.1 epimerase [Chromobacterium violaceum]OQS24582.1 epimerase [Chromobacterium violaceum]